jgi:hypothetical protein
MTLMSFAVASSIGCAGNRPACCNDERCPQASANTARPTNFRPARARAYNPAGPNPGAPGACLQVTPTTGPVSAATARALREALMDERRAHDTYMAVLARHGQVRPFVNIVQAESRHEAALEAAMQRHGVEIPADRPTDLPAVPGTVRECGALAAQLERDNVALYDRLMADVSEPDIRAVFDNLRRCSQANHLPALERSAAAATASPVQRFRGPGPNRPYGAGYGFGAR